MLGLFGGFEAVAFTSFSVHDAALLLVEVSMVNPSGLEAKRHLVPDADLSLLSSCEGNDVCELLFNERFEVEEDDLESFGSGSW